MMSQENGFWNACREQKKDILNNWTALKDENGQRVLDPESQKIVAATYFQTLYSPDPSLPSHEHHATVEIKLEIYENDFDYDDLEYNEVPSIKEVENVIKNKKKLEIHN